MEHIISEAFSCEQCQKSFATKKILRRHLREIHPAVKEAQNIQCEICGKKFNRNSNLLRHMSSVHADEVEAVPEWKHECGVCGAKFKQKCHLKEHLLIHEGVRYVCDICGHSFSRQQTLKAHMVSHHRESTEDEKDSHAHCKKIAFMPHDDHIDYLLACGSIFCNSTERLLPDDHIHNDSAIAINEPHCPHKGCSTITSPDAQCDHFKRAKVVKHGDHFDIAFNGYLWNSVADDTSSVTTYVNHGPFPMTEIDEGVEGFLDFLSKDLFTTTTTTGGEEGK